MANMAENTDDSFCAVSGDKTACKEYISNKNLCSGEQKEDSEGDFFENSWGVIKVGIQIKAHACKKTLVEK